MESIQTKNKMQKKLFLCRTFTVTPIWNSSSVALNTRTTRWCAKFQIKSRRCDAVAGDERGKIGFCPIETADSPPVLGYNKIFSW